MALRTDKATPGALAADLAKANDRLKAAQVQFEFDRKAVIKRGTERVQHIAALQSELAKEQADIQSVISKA